ncbi:hypothetical protein [Sulfuracidifex metallicus]|uniref:hypothetical protein n=1 Tax=Sulfuracidifex metallicus TaxID=47303 RepID=UPI0022767C62|nr:hypothetical protein [Sulfuracidifex metallicus]MCY0849432.1 hypothetical protein [Sulfuracidifex metallicus]
MKKVWKFLSLIGHPLIQLPIWFFVISSYYYGAFIAFLLLPLVVISGSVFPYFLYRGKNSDLREVRPRVLFISSILYFIVSLIIFNYIISAIALLTTSLVTFVDGLISLKWKISIHATAISGFITYGYLTIGFPVLFWVPFGFLVVISRYVLRKHTISQLFAGTLIGFIISLIIWAIYLNEF